MDKTIKHINGDVGGYLVGRRHSQGGIKAINKATGQPLEMEGGEVVITRNAVSDTEKREFEGEMLTNREILSRINQSGGGVSFEDGGEIQTDGRKYKYGGNVMSDEEIVYQMSLRSDIDDIDLDSIDKYDFGGELDAQDFTLDSSVIPSIQNKLARRQDEGTLFMPIGINIPNCNGFKTFISQEDLKDGVFILHKPKEINNYVKNYELNNNPRFVVFSEGNQAIMVYNLGFSKGKITYELLHTYNDLKSLQQYFFTYQSRNENNYFSVKYNEFNDLNKWTTKLFYNYIEQYSKYDKGKLKTDKKVKETYREFLLAFQKNSFNIFLGFASNVYGTLFNKIDDCFVIIRLMVNYGEKKYYSYYVKTEVDLYNAISSAWNESILTFNPSNNIGMYLEVDLNFLVKELDFTFNLNIGKIYVKSDSISKILEDFFYNNKYFGLSYKDVYNKYFSYSSNTTYSDIYYQYQELQNYYSTTIKNINGNRQFNNDFPDDFYLKYKFNVGEEVIYLTDRNVREDYLGSKWKISHYHRDSKNISFSSIPKYSNQYKIDASFNSLMDEGNIDKYISNMPSYPLYKLHRFDSIIHLYDKQIFFDDRDKLNPIYLVGGDLACKSEYKNYGRDWYFNTIYNISLIDYKRVEFTYASDRVGRNFENKRKAYYYTKNSLIEVEILDLKNSNETLLNPEGTYYKIKAVDPDWSTIDNIYVPPYMLRSIEAEEFSEVIEQYLNVESINASQTETQQTGTQQTTTEVKENIGERNVKVTIEEDPLDAQIFEIKTLLEVIPSYEFEDRIILSQQLDELLQQKNIYVAKRTTDANPDFIESMIIADSKQLEERPNLIIYNDGFQPNGSPTQLSKSNYDLVHTEEFKRWFGNYSLAYNYKNIGEDEYNLSSKVVTEGGEPLVVYMGVGRAFEKITFKRFPIAYYAVNIDYAEWFATQKGQMNGTQGYVLPFFLNVRNPLDFTQFGINKIKPQDFFDLLYLQTGMTGKELGFDDRWFLPNVPEMEVWVYIRNCPNFLNMLKQYKICDGIHFYENNPSVPMNDSAYQTEVWTTFYSNQTKLASNQRGIYILGADNSFFMKKGGLI